MSRSHFTPHFEQLEDRRLLATLVSGQQVSDFLALDEIQNYQITAEAGSQLNILVRANETTGAAIALLGSGGQVLTQDSGSDEAQIEYIAQESGSFTIRVSDWFRGDGLDFDLHFFDSGSELLAYQENDRHIVSGQEIQTTVAEDDFSVITWDAEVPGEITLNAYNSRQWEFALFAPDGSKVSESLNGNFSSIPTEQTGQYKILLQRGTFNRGEMLSMRTLIRPSLADSILFTERDFAVENDELQNGTVPRRSFNIHPFAVRSGDEVDITFSGSTNYQITDVFGDSIVTFVKNEDTSFFIAEETEQLALLVHTTSFGASADYEFRIAGNTGQLEYTPTNLTLAPAIVEENAAPQTLLGELSADDLDMFETLAFELASGDGDEYNDFATIVDAEVFLTKPLDHEESEMGSIRVRVVDSKGNFSEKPLTFEIQDVNEAPTELTLSHSSIDENLPAETTVGILSSLDPDADNTLSYSLISGPGDTDNAAFQIAFGELRTNESLDFEAQNQYSVRIAVTDQDGLQLERAFEIDVLDELETPEDVDGDNAVSAIDALIVINFLNQRGDDPIAPGDRRDVNRDGFVTAIDALTIVFLLNQRSDAEGEFSTLAYHAYGPQQQVISSERPHADSLELDANPFDWYWGLESEKQLEAQISRRRT
ncbi:MAG: cadherin domain-containing protein [Planctomycetota bacterium]